MHQSRAHIRILINRPSLSLYLSLAVFYYKLFARLQLYRYYTFAWYAGLAAALTNCPR